MMRQIPFMNLFSRASVLESPTTLRGTGWPYARKKIQTTYPHCV